MKPSAFADPPADGFQTLDTMPQAHLEGSSIAIQRVTGRYVPDDKIQIKIGIQFDTPNGLRWAGGYSLLIDQLQEHVNRLRKVLDKYRCTTTGGTTYVIPEPVPGPEYEVLDTMKLDHLAASNGVLSIERNADPSRVPADVLQLQISMRYDGQQGNAKGFSIQHPQADDYIRRMEHVLVRYGIAPEDPA